MLRSETKSTVTMLQVKNDDELSLLKLTQRVLVKYITTLTDVGDLPYHLIKPIIVRIDSPLQLTRIEKSSPHLLAHTGPIWRKLITRDFGAEAVPKYTPSSSTPHLRTWSQVYDLHNTKVADAQSKATEKLRAQFQSLKEQKGGFKTKLVSANALPKVGRSKGGWGGMEKAERRWDVKSGSRTKNIITRAKREAKEMGCFFGGKSKLSVPMHQLGVGAVSQTLKEKEQKRKEALEVKDTKWASQKTVGFKRKLDDLQRDSSNVSMSSARSQSIVSNTSTATRTSDSEPPRKIIQRKPTTANPFMPSKPPLRR